MWFFEASGLQKSILKPVVFKIKSLIMNVIGEKSIS